uniref:CUE domain-containing protein n=1 Tax=Noccaea caerulescens TaxID=107243 RepID=A0A1J3FWZ8_NOCCA
MGFSSVYRSLTEIFPQIDARILRAVAIEHPKDADEAAAVVLSEIVPSLPSNLSHYLNHSLNKSSGSISAREVERDLEDVVSRCRGFVVASGSKSSASSSSETTPLVVARGHDTSAPSTKLVSDGNEITNFPLTIGRGVYHKDVESDEVQSLEKALGKEHEKYDFFGKCFDVPNQAIIGLKSMPEDDLASVVSAVAQDSVKSNSYFWQDLDFHMTWNQAESGTSIGSENAVQKLVDIIPGDNMTSIQQGSCVEVGTASTNAVDETSKGSLASENGNTELGVDFNSSTPGCSVDHLEEIIEDAKSNKKTLHAVMESVMNLMKEVELEEKDAEKSEEEAARGGIDTLEKVEDLKKMLKHAKEANDMHAGEVYGEKSILATEAKELENRLLNLSEERNKSLAVLDEMSETFKVRLAAALEMKKAAEQEKKEKEDSARKALAEQEAIMEKVVQESNLLKQEAEENSKLREFLMDRGQVVDSLQGEISVICQDVKLLKEKFDNRVSLTKSVSSSQTSSCGSSIRGFVFGSPSKRLNEVLETSSNSKSPEAAASSSVNKEIDARRALLEDDWEIWG